MPLKIGIFEDLLPHAQKLALTEAELREAIKTWCRGARYWACLIEGASRMDLAGQEAGQVRPEDEKRAQQLQARRAATGAIQTVEDVVTKRNREELSARRKARQHAPANVISAPIEDRVRE